MANFHVKQMIRLLNFLVLNLFIWGCGASIPKWMKSGATLEDPRLIYGKGSSKESYNAAESNALAKIALGIKTEIKTVLTLDKKSTSTGDSSEVFWEEFEEEIQIISRLTLPDVSIKGSYFDEKTKTYWALAAIPKETLRRMLFEELERSKGKVTSHYLAGLEYQTSGEIRLALREFYAAYDSLGLLKGRTVKVDLNGDGTDEDLETTVRRTLQSLLNGLQVTIKPMFNRVYLGSSLPFEFQVNCNLRSQNTGDINLEGIKLKCRILPSVCDCDRFVILNGNGNGSLSINNCTLASRDAELQLELDMMSLIQSEIPGSSLPYLPKPLPYTTKIDIKKPTIGFRFRLVDFASDLEKMSTSILSKKLKNIGFNVARTEATSDEQTPTASDFIAGNVISLVEAPHIGKRGITFARLSWKFALGERRPNKIIFEQTFTTTQGGSGPEQAFRRCLEKLADDIGGTIKSKIFIR